MTRQTAAENHGEDLEREVNRARMPNGYDTLADLLNSHYTILTILADDTVGHTIGHVTRALDVDLSTASRQISHAARLDLLTWTQALEDHRVRILHLTDLGRHALARAREARHQTLSEVLRDWTDDDLATLLDLARRFNAAGERLPSRGRARP